MAQNKKIIIPVVCENLKCRNFSRVVNAISGILLDDMDLFYEGYGSYEEADYCPVCGELGTAEDAIFA